MILRTVLIISLLLTVGAGFSPAQVVDIPDSNLRAAVEKVLGKASGATITAADMATLTRLEAKNANINDLTGLEGATNLTELWLQRNNISNISAVVGLTKLTFLRLDNNNITDISPLEGLTNLETLDLDRNAISDISAVAGLTSLTFLDIWGTSISDISPVAGLINLTTLGLGSNNISDISPVAGLTNLTGLYLLGNHITDISFLSGLTNLKTLWLQNNWISDLSPLVTNTGLGSGDTLDVRSNCLSEQSLYTHIPALQGRGVTVKFDNAPPIINANGMVRLIYFVPSDRPARPDRVVAIRQLIKDAQRFYADEIQRHGFGRKTFTVETDVNGEPLVHQVNGKFPEAHYYQPSSLSNVLAEFPEHFTADDFQHVYFIAIDLSYEALNGGGAGGLGGVSFHPRCMAYDPDGRIRLRIRELTIGENAHGGFAIIPASGVNFGHRVTVHELGHALGLAHDFREGRHSGYVMAGGKSSRFSKCAAEWLSASRFFNTKSTFHNEPSEIQLLSLRAYSQDVIHLRFEVTDPDGLHQAQLLVPEIVGDVGYIWKTSMLFDCERLSGTTGTIDVAVRTAELAGRIGLQIMDAGGNIAWAFFPIELDEVAAAQNALDVNIDGVVNLSDLMPFVSRLGQHGKDTADVNGDGVVDIFDVMLVAAFISALPRQTVEMFTEADVQQWLTDARALDIENEIMVKGIIVLEYLLAEIALLSEPMEVATGPLKAIFVGHTHHVWSVAFSPDGSTLASASWDKTIRLWNPDTGEHKNTLIGHTSHINSVAFSPDGGTLASASRDKTIRLWNPDTGKLKRTLIGYARDVASVAFSPDEQTLAGSGVDPIIRLWNTTTWQVERTLPGHTGLVEIVAFSQDGGMIASGSWDGTIRLWNPHTAKHIKTLTATSPVNRLAFSPDGQTLASSSWDGTIRLWNPHTGKLKKTLPNQGGWVNTVAFSRDGGTLAIGNRGISLWDIETGQYKEPLAENIGDAVSLVFSPDGTMLASGSGDSKVRLWDFTPADTSSDKTNGDINGDGSVNVLDLILIISNLDTNGTNLAEDVNGDGVVSILDLVLTAGMFDGAAAAPSAQPQVPETLTAVEVQGWLTDTRSLQVRDPTMKRGILVLEQLLISLTPKETQLLANYPNPFNPETWIPYRLAEDAFVTLTIYDLSGQVVRTLDVGYRIASAYENQSKAVYWDGRNEFGESVASGMFFYHLSAGDYSATRKMLILK